MGIAKIEPRYKVSVYHHDIDSDRCDGATKKTCYCESYEEANEFFHAERIVAKLWFTGKFEDDMWGDARTKIRCVLSDEEDLFIIKLDKIVSD